MGKEPHPPERPHQPENKHSKTMKRAESASTRITGSFNSVLVYNILPPMLEVTVAG